MRAIGKINNPHAALEVHKYLSGKGIDCRLDREPDGVYTLWIVDEGQFAAAGDLLKEYEAARAAQPAGPAIPSMTQRMAAAPLTAALVVISVGVTLFSGFGTNPDITDYLYFDPALILSGQAWRLVSPMFLHFTILHLAFNMFWLLDLGWMIERRFGRLWLGGLVVVVAVISCFAQYFRSGPEFGGMSGVVYGLFGFVWIRSLYDPAPYFQLGRSAVITMIAWLFLCMTGYLGNIANTAHVAGLVVGILWALAAWPGFKNKPDAGIT